MGFVRFGGDDIPGTYRLLSARRSPRGIATGESLRQIAGRLGRAASTLCREVTRNGGRHRYRAQRADRAALGRARRPKTAKLAVNTKLRGVVEDKLTEWWSAAADLGVADRHIPWGAGDVGEPRNHLFVIVCAGQRSLTS